MSVILRMKLAEDMINRGFDALRGHSRKYIQARATPIWADIEAMKAIYRDRDIANLLHGPNSYHVDHIIPLMGETVSGLHCECNLKVIPASENLSKGNKLST